MRDSLLFCSLYGIEYKDGPIGDFATKVGEIYRYYKDVLNGEEIKEIFQELGIDNKKQMINFSKSWTFLKKGMKFSNDLAAAVMANWYGEGGFSETNLQNTNENQKLDDSKDYTYDINDNHGWGIMQWTHFSRKANLEVIATEMNAGVGNINVQFALFKKEISAGGDCCSEWEQVMSAKEVEGYTAKFVESIENPDDKYGIIKRTRIGYAHIIKDGMEGKL